MNVGVRRATDDDAQVVAVLAAAAIAEQADARGGRVWSQREALRQPSTDGVTFLGTIDDTPVGYVAVDVDRLADGSLLGVVSGIYVDPGAREVAVGEAMIDEVLSWCTERGCIGVDAHALPGNRQTKNFFETFGFTARLLVVHRSLR